MLYGVLAVLRHDILPRGPSGPAVLAGLVVIAGLATSYAYHAVEVRLQLGPDDLFDLLRTAVIAALVLSAVAGLFAGSLFGGVVVLGVPAIAGLGASTLVIHRRSPTLVRPRPIRSSQPNTVRGDVAIGAVAFVGAALGMLALPWLFLGIALA